jgi:hypothetical protein
MCFVPFPLAKSTDHFSLRSPLLPVLTTWTCCDSCSVNTGTSWLRKEKMFVDFARGNGTKHSHAIFPHDYSLAVEPASTPRLLVQKETWRDSLPIDMLLSAVCVLVVAQSSSEIPEGVMNNPVLDTLSGLVCCP